MDCYRRTQSGLLATSRTKAKEEKEVTELIRSRYLPFFEAYELPDVVVERPMFDLAALRRRVSIQNPINVGNEGKRILCWFPHLEIGGADKFNLDLLRGLKERGYNITIVTTVPAQHRWFKSFYEITPDIFHLPELLHYGHWLAFARYMLESRHVDICFISNAYYAYYLLPLLRRDFPDVAFVDYTHTEDPGWRAGGYPRVSCQFSEFLDRHIVTSNKLASHFIELNERVTSKIKVVLHQRRRTVLAGKCRKARAGTPSNAIWRFCCFAVSSQDDCAKAAFVVCRYYQCASAERVCC